MKTTRSKELSKMEEGSTKLSQFRTYKSPAKNACSSNLFWDPIESFLDVSPFHVLLETLKLSIPNMVAKRA